MLSQSLDNQSVECNRIFIDTKKYGFKSAAEAYNNILNNPERYVTQLTDHLMFVHQDIYFDDKDTLLKFEAILQQSPNDIFGLAGVTSDRKVFSNLQRQGNKAFIVKNQLQQPISVETLDECCFAMTFDLCRKIQFDETICFGWHLYAADFCYNANRKYASKSYVLPYKAYHKYDSSKRQNVDIDFLYVINNLVLKYKDDYQAILTPCYYISTSFLACKLKLLKSYCKIFLKFK